MERAALLHRPESEFAYLYNQETLHLRLRTKRHDAKEVTLIAGDPYLIELERWYQFERKMKKETSSQLYDYWVIEVQAPFKRLQYAFHLVGEDGDDVFYGDRGISDFEQLIIEDKESYFRLPYFQEADRVSVPKWASETVWYQIFPERFANGDRRNDPIETLPWGSKAHPGVEDYYGGDLQGVIDKLDYLAHLGVNGLYFCPLFKAGSNHKYDTIDYYQIDPAFGDNKLFKELVEAAHQRGMKIMLDAVFNHMGYYAPQWQDVLENEEKSSYVDWFYIDSFPVKLGENGNVEGQPTLSYDTFSFVPNMPKLNTNNPDVQKYLLDIATYWLKEYDIDAWRLDVANEVDHQFWKLFHRETTKVKPDVYILGEIWHSAQNWLNGDEFHGVMNYAYTKTIQDCLIQRTISPAALVSGLNDQLMLYRQQTNEVMFNMLDSHDTARLLTQCRDDKELAKLTLAFMFMQPGAPCIYYGTEIGLTGENDPDCRKCMIWEEPKQDLEFLTFTKALIAFRKRHFDTLAQGNTEFMTSYSDSADCLVVKRQLNNKEIIGIFNINKQELDINLLHQEDVLQESNTVINSDGFLIGENGYLLVAIKAD